MDKVQGDKNKHKLHDRYYSQQKNILRVYEMSGRSGQFQKMFDEE